MNEENTHTTLTATTRNAAPDMMSDSQRQTTSAQETLAELAAEINRVIDPPQTLGADDILVRSLLLVSGGTNHYGGKFGEQELRRIADLALDSPVLVGHRKDTLPIARVFRAEVITHEAEQWVRAHFYWLKKASGAETLATNIDGGLYKECSLGFTFMRAECSVCGSDIRSCAHTPSADNNSASYYYRDIQRVLEISLVYRGATPNTKVGAALGALESLGFSELSLITNLARRRQTDFVPKIALERICLMSNTRELTPAELVTHHITAESSAKPCAIASSELQHDLPLLIGRSGGELFALRDDGLPAPDSLASAVLNLAEYPEQDFLIYGRLVGMRGKQRRSLSDLAKRLNSGAGPVRSFKLRAVALLYWNNLWSNADNAQENQNTLRNICKNTDRLSFAMYPKRSSANHHTACEQVLALGGGRFQFLRAPGNPGTVCRRIVADERIDSLPAQGSQRANCVDSEDNHQPAIVSMLKYDRVIKNSGRLRLVNARIGASLHDLCGEETYVFVKPSEARDVVINQDTTIHVSHLSEQPLSFASCDSPDILPGICYALYPKDAAPISPSNTVNLSIGGAAQLQLHPGDREKRSARVIELSYDDKQFAALLIDERTPDVAART